MIDLCVVVSVLEWWLTTVIAPWMGLQGVTKIDIYHHHETKIGGSIRYAKTHRNTSDRPRSNLGISTNPSFGSTANKPRTGAGSSIGRFLTVPPTEKDRRRAHTMSMMMIFTSFMTEKLILIIKKIINIINTMTNIIFVTILMMEVWDKMQNLMWNQLTTRGNPVYGTQVSFENEVNMRNDSSYLSRSIFRMGGK